MSTVTEIAFVFLFFLKLSIGELNNDIPYNDAKVVEDFVIGMVLGN